MDIENECYLVIYAILIMKYTVLAHFIIKYIISILFFYEKFCS